MDSQLKHDFINNSLRLEVLNKLICEQLDLGQIVDKELIADCENFLNQQLKFIEKLREE